MSTTELRAAKRATADLFISLIQKATEAPSAELGIQLLKGTLSKLQADSGGVHVAASPWVDLTSDKLSEVTLPDDENPLGHDESVRVWARWDNGDVEVSFFHYTGIDDPVFQRLEGTNEGCEGWQGNAGHVTHWMPYNVPASPV